MQLLSIPRTDKFQDQISNIITGGHLSNHGLAWHRLQCYENAVVENYNAILTFFIYWIIQKIINPG